MVQQQWETVWQFFKKLNIELPYNTIASVSFSGLMDKQFANIHKKELSTNTYSNMGEPRKHAK